MKLIYGKGECCINGINEEINSVVIRYSGCVILRLKHAELVNVLNNNLHFRHLKSKSLLVRGNNQIHIGFLPPVIELEELFRYTGNFKILSAKVNDKNIAVELFGVDYWNLINSNWDNAGKPESYKGTYRFGRIPQKKGIKRGKQRIKGRNIERLSKGVTGGY